MNIRFATRLMAVMLIIGTVAGCANTIRGVGRDAANSVDATQQAGRNIRHAAN
ncbi:entericidin [Ochrobactrum sp. P6BS-III]|nr:putative small secreted protein [Ochrobactrum sp. P6BSIII]OOL13582.1 entericidin [Ochrobactrum sp. P6BS-III]